MELEIRQNVPLSQYTALKVGGVADYVVEVYSVEELQAACRFAKQTDTLPLILGGGSNVLIDDAGYRGLVILMKTKGISISPLAEGEVLVRATAGERWDTLVETAVAEGLSYLENLSGIPGTVGAAPVQNINAYGASVAEVIESVEVYDIKKDTLRVLTNAECLFGYRDSIFKTPAGANLIVLAVTFRLAVAEQINLSYRSASQSIEKYLKEKQIVTPTPVDVRNAILHVRGNIGMLEGQFRSAGSFFKNTIVSAETFKVVKHVVEGQFSQLSAELSPWYWILPSGEVKLSTAFLMECSPYNKRSYGTTRWKGVVGLSPRHSLSVVTEEGATASDVHSFVQEIKTSIRNIFGITLETEVNFIPHK